MLTKTVLIIHNAKLAVARRYKLKACNLEHSHTMGLGMIIVHKTSGIKYLVNGNNITRLVSPLR